jgi:hypothetical protein
MKAVEYAISLAKMYNAELIAINVLTSDIGYIYSSLGIESSSFGNKGNHIVS